MNDFYTITREEVEKIFTRWMIEDLMHPEEFYEGYDEDYGEDCAKYFFELLNKVKLRG